MIRAHSMKRNCSPAALARPWSFRYCQSMVRLMILSLMSCVSVGSMKGLVFVSLHVCDVRHVLRIRPVDLHREDYHADAPTVDNVLITGTVSLGDNLRRKVTRRPTHGLYCGSGVSLLVINP